MIVKRQTLRYYYWLTLEFVKKHSRMILLSFFLSFFILVSIISFSPILNRFFFSKKEIIGIAGDYDFSNLPSEITEKISHGLIFSDQKGQLLPALASSWEMIGGGKEFRFHLKNNLFWDDGKEFTAKDLAYDFKDVDKKIIDKDTIYFTLKKKLPIFPTYLTKPVLKYPLHGVGGLYQVDKFITTQGLIKEIDLSPNKSNYPFLVYKFYDSESKLINAYKTGSINKMTLLKKSLADTFATWKNSKITRSVDYSKVLTLFFNLKNPLLSNKDARQAIALGVPRENFVSLGQPANSPIPPVSWAYNPNLKESVEDLDSAKKAIKKYLDASASAQLNFVTYYDYLSMATDIDQNLNKIGLKTNLNLSNLDRPDNFDLLLAFWQIPEDPDQYFFWHSTQVQGNITGYKNVKVDKLLEDGRTTLLINDRKQYYFDFQKTLSDDQPAIFIYYPYTYTIERK